MTPYEKDLEYAKNMVRIRDAFFYKKLDNEKSIIKSVSYDTNNDNAQYFLYEFACTESFEEDYIIEFNPANIEPVCRETLVSTESILLEQTDTHITFCNEDGNSEISIPYPLEYSEDIHFQNSLIYDEFTNRMILISWYMYNNPLAPEIMYDFYYTEYDRVLQLVDNIDE